MIVRLLVVGGGGYVAGLILPVLERRWDIRILDAQPGVTAYQRIVGDATDHRVLASAMDHVDAVLHCAMGGGDIGSPVGVASAFDVNVKSVHLTLAAAHAAGIRHTVYISSMSVFHDLTARRLDESTPPDARDPYGLTKRLGEEVCRTAVAEWGMSVTVLRLVWPTPDDVWPAWAPPGEEPRVWRTPEGTPIHGTAASDLGDAVVRALDHRDGFALFTISGDDSARLWSIDKARRLLGWTPTRTSI